MSDKPVIKRFIAGAVCPACSEMDTIRTYQDDDGRPARECVSCGYADTLDERGNAVPREVPTRVSKAKPAAEKKVQTVQFFPNPKLKKK